jgi:hypothetical protein
MEGTIEYKSSRRFLEGVSAPRFEYSAKNPRSETREKFRSFVPEAYIPVVSDRREQSKTMSLLSSGRSSLDQLPNLQRRTIDGSSLKLLPSIKKAPQKQDLKSDDPLLKLLRATDTREKLTEQILLLQKKFDTFCDLKKDEKAGKQEVIISNVKLPAIKGKSRQRV